MIKTINIFTEKIEEDIINQAIIHLKTGGLIIYPTDTSYGLGAIYSNSMALAKIFLLKHREKSKKLSVIVPTIEWAINNLDVNTAQQDILRKYLPGKYTFILNVKNSNNTLGIRLPNNNFILMLTRILGEPITATSANVSGQNDCFSVDELNRGILKNINRDKLDILVFDAGPLKIGERSTVVDLTSNKPKILRQGSGKFPQQTK